MKAELVFELCHKEDCDCDLPHIPSDFIQQMDYVAALAQIYEWRWLSNIGMKAKLPN